MEYKPTTTGHTRLAHALGRAKRNGSKAPVCIDQKSAQIIVDEYKQRLLEAKQREIKNRRRAKLLQIELYE
jgi:hypothetical protein